MMTEKRVAIIASPTQRDAIQAIRLPLAGLFNPVRGQLKDSPVPVFDDFDGLLRRSKADICCFLFPYPTLEQDVLKALEREIHVLAAGPVARSRHSTEHLLQTASRSQVRLSWGNQHIYSPLYRELLAHSGSDSFGDPVYLRQVGGGGDSLLSTWWTSCWALELAQALLSSRLEELHVTATRAGHRYHAVLTALMANRATAQLVIAPVSPFPAPDITLLGTGGLLANGGLGNVPALITRNNVRLHPPPHQRPEPEWLLDFSQHLDQPNPPELPALLDLQQNLLGTLRQAPHLGIPVQLPSC